MSRQKYTLYKQLSFNDCGPTCLRIICKYYGYEYDHDYLCQLSRVCSDGTSLFHLQEAAKALGFRSMVASIPLDKLDHLVPPFIAYWKSRHFIVVTRVTLKGMCIIDPRHGSITHSVASFSEYFLTPSPNATSKGIVLLLEPVEG